MKAPTQQGFPNVSAPLVNSEGTIQQSWLQLLINLWIRTGAGLGGNTFNAGDIKQAATSGDQAGWLVCDGRTLRRTDYVVLFAAIGTTYGAGDGFSTFNIPDYRSRFLIGASALYPLGTTGGGSAFTLTVGNLPPHKHGVTDPGHTHTVTDPGHTHTVTDPGHTHTVTDPGHHHDITVASGSGPVNAQVVLGAPCGLAATSTATTGVTVARATTEVTNASHTTGNTNVANTTGNTNVANTTGVTTQNTGSGDPITILPPYAPVTLLIKT